MIWFITYHGTYKPYYPGHRVQEKKNPWWANLYGKLDGVPYNRPKTDDLSCCSKRARTVPSGKVQHQPTRALHLRVTIWRAYHENILVKTAWTVNRLDLLLENRTIRRGSWHNRVAIHHNSQMDNPKEGSSVINKQSHFGPVHVVSRNFPICEASGIRSQTLSRQNGDFLGYIVDTF